MIALVRDYARLPDLILVSALTISAPAVSLGQLEDAPFNERPADGTVTISNSSSHDGTFTLSTVARVCGEVPAELNFAGVPTFIVHFYSETGTEPLQDISFDSKELVGGVTTSSTFFLSTSVKSPSIGSPPAFVLDTSRDGMSGAAKLTPSDEGALELDVDGTNDMGERIRLSLKCWPRASNG